MTYDDADRAEQDYWAQQIPSGSESEAMLRVMQLVFKHQFVDIMTIVKGYQDVGRADDAMIVQINKTMAIIVAQNENAGTRIDALLRKVALLEQREQIFIVDSAQMERRLLVLEQQEPAADPRIAFIEQARDMMNKLTSLISHVAALESGAQHATLDRDRVRRQTAVSDQRISDLESGNYPRLESETEN
jgi:uncharacterized protein YaaN involved in tellurite resistance